MARDSWEVPHGLLNAEFTDDLQKIHMTAKHSIIAPSRQQHHSPSVSVGPFGAGMGSQSVLQQYAKPGESTPDIMESKLSDSPIKVDIG
jgi:hypothetical protein